MTIHLILVVRLLLLHYPSITQILSTTRLEPLEVYIDKSLRFLYFGSRTEQAIDVQMEVFGVSDDKFLEMFVAPGAIEKLEREYATLQKRSMTLLTCLHEFRTLAHSL